MPKKMIAFCILLIFFSVFSGGCQSILISQNEPITVQSSFFDPDDVQNGEQLSIDSISKLGHGIVQDISTQNNALLITDTTKAPPITYNVNLLNLSDNALSSFVNSDKQQNNAIFDSDNNGVFYIEKNASDSTATNSQLVWTSIDRTVTKTISNPNENVQNTLCLANNQTVLYLNIDNEIIQKDLAGHQKKYQTQNHYFIDKMRYQSGSNTLYFLGKKDVDDEFDNLYSATLETNEQGQDTNMLKTKQIAQDVIDFDINDKNTQIAYIEKFNNSHQIVSINLSNMQKRNIKKDNYNSIIYAQDNSHIIVTKSDNNGEQDQQSIWIINQDKKTQQQLTSPMLISSPIIPSKDKNSLYFSVQKNNSTSSLNLYDQIIYQITYSFK